MNAGSLTENAGREPDSHLKKQLCGSSAPTLTPCRVPLCTLQHGCSGIFRQIPAAVRASVQTGCSLEGNMQPAETVRGGNNMLETIAIVLVLLWALGLVSSVSMGGFIHVLLVIAVVIILIRLIQGKRL